MSDDQDNDLEDQAEETEVVETTDEEVEAQPAETEPEEVEAEEPPKFSDKDRRQLLRQRAKAKAQAEQYRQELEYYKQIAQSRPAPPNIDDFESDQAYGQATTEHHQQVAKAAAAELIAQQREQQYQQTIVNDWNQQCQDARGKHKDFDAVALGNHWSPSPAMKDAILDSDNGADVAYYLGKHPDEAARIAALSPVAQVREIGRIETKLDKPQPRTSRAPAPIKPVSGGGRVSPKDIDKMTMEEYAAFRRGR